MLNRWVGETEWLYWPKSSDRREKGILNFRWKGEKSGIYVACILYVPNGYVVHFLF
jgi:hypothetical protein